MKSKLQTTPPIRMASFLIALMYPKKAQNEEMVAEMTPEILRMIRKVEDLSIRQMASRVGLSASLIKKIERGERNITKRTERKVLAIFNEYEQIQKIKELTKLGGKSIARTTSMERSSPEC